MRESTDAVMKKNIEFLEKVFKKWSPNIISSPYIPTPSVLVKSDGENGKKERLVGKKKINRNPTAKPSKKESSKKYEDIIDYLHKGALAYGVGDYGTAINYFTRLLEIDWLEYSSYFYLVKTLIKLEIEKELLSLRTISKKNNVRLTKSE